MTIKSQEAREHACCVMALSKHLEAYAATGKGCFLDDIIFTIGVNVYAGRCEPVDVVTPVVVRESQSIHCTE